MDTSSILVHAVHRCFFFSLVPSRLGLLIVAESCTTVLQHTRFEREATKNFLPYECSSMVIHCYYALLELEKP